MKRLSINFRSVPWPSSEDILFKEDSDWWHNAHLALGGKGWGAYAAGYKKAADSLARRFIKNWQGNNTGQSEQYSISILNQVTAIKINKRTGETWKLNRLEKVWEPLVEREQGAKTN